MADSAPSSTPFPALSALSRERLRPRHRLSSSSTSTPAPNNDPEEFLTYPPGEPTISLVPAEVYAFLSRELDTLVLDELYSKLWLVARKSGRSIDSLHQQKVKGRDIVPIEDAKLHLVWQQDKIYVKPIPVCLLNHDFWTTYLPLRMDSTSSRVSGSQNKRNHLVPGSYHSVAVGFLRSYAFLVQHHLDFILARESHLIPAEIDWVKWSTFIANFRCIEDDQVAKRYHYGQLRLSRLHWAVRIFRPQTASTVWFYEIPYWSTNLYVQRALAPFLIAFACLSIVLSSMQVVLAVPADGLGTGQLDSSGLDTMRRAFWVFSISVLLLSSVLWFLLLLIPLSVIGWQLSWGFKNRGRSDARGVAPA
jgi:hypothetical protein